MKVHEVVNDATLQVVLDAIDDDLAANIDEFDVGHVRLILVDGLVDLLVVADPVAEVTGRFLRILTDVVWRGCFDFANVAHDEILVVTLRFHEHCRNLLIIATVLYPATSRFGRVGRIQDGNGTAVGFEPVDHVLDRCFGGDASETLSFGIRRVEELGGRCRRVGTAIFANIEATCFD